MIWHLRTLQDDHKTSSCLSPIPSYYSVTDHVPYALSFTFPWLTYFLIGCLYLLAPLTYLPHAPLPTPVYPCRSGNHAFVLCESVFAFLFLNSTCKWEITWLFVFLVWFISYPLDYLCFCRWQDFLFKNGKIPFFNKEIMAFSEQGRFKNSCSVCLRITWSCLLTT